MTPSSFDVPTPAFAAAVRTDPAPPRATPADAFLRAREVFLAGERLDMARLAGELDVARTTLYRWTGDRDRLLSDVCWAVLADLLDQVEASRRPERGKAILEAVSAGLLRALADAAPLQAFLQHEGEAGLQLLTAPAGGVRPRLVARVARRIAEEADAGTYRPPADPRVLADAIVSLGERFLYHGGDPSRNPDPATATRAIELLLREDPA